MLKTILLTAIFIIIMILGYSNNQTVTINLIPNYPIFELKLYLIIFISFISGIILTSLSYSFKIFGLKLVNFKQKRNIKKLEKNSSKNQLNDD